MAVGSGLVDLLLLLRLLSKVAEDVIEDEVAVGLLGEDEGLDEALVRLALVGNLTNDLDDDVGIGALGVDVGDADLGVLEVELLDALVDGLCMCQLVYVAIGYVSYTFWPRQTFTLSSSTPETYWERLL